MKSRFWLVQCGDDPGKVTFEMHPYIHFHCKHCGQDGGAILNHHQGEPSANRTHKIMEKKMKFRNQREFIEFMEQPHRKFLKALVAAPTVG